LAERADVSARFISFLETARRQPSLSAIHALSKGLGVQMPDLISEAERIYEERNLTNPKDTDQT
jgi:transcriptional regulator with XRE-family HTH domain